MAAEGYPGKYPKGMEITGADTAADAGALVFHAGTQLERGVVKSNGGRVMGVTAVGNGFEDAIANAYRGVDAIQFDNAYYRKDIGHRVRDRF